MRARIGSAFAWALCAWCFGYGIGAGASWWALALGGLGVVVSGVIATLPRREVETLEVTTPTARQVMHGPIKVRVVTTTMRDVERSEQ